MERDYKTSNPVLNEKIFDRASNPTGLHTVNSGSPIASSETMTVGGTVSKIYFLLGICVAACTVTWHFASTAVAGTSVILPWVIAGALIGLVLGIIIPFNPGLAPILSPFYAAFQGLALGGISVHYESMYPGIVMQAIGLTFCVFLGMLFTFSSGLIKATEKFKMGVCAATVGVFIFYMLTLVMAGVFHMQVPMIHDSGIMGIGFSLFVVVLAALNLVISFDFIQVGVEKKAPKKLEWYAAFGLIVTLVWLYLELLRLVSKLRSR